MAVASSRARAAEVVRLTMSSIFERIDSLPVQEMSDYSAYDVADTLFNIMGFGRRRGAGADVRSGIGWTMFRAPLMLVAEGLGATIDDITFDRQVVVTKEPFDIKAGRIEAGTVSAQRFSGTAIIGGRPALTVEHITRVQEDQAPDWPTGRGWKVTVEGRPSMVLGDPARHPWRG